MEAQTGNHIEIDRIVDLAFQQLIKENVGDYIISIEDIMQTLNNEKQEKRKGTASFHEKWQRQFSKMMKRPFYCQTDDQWNETWMMHLSSVLFTGNIPELNCRVLELPFANFTKSMYVLLPNDKTGLNALEEALNSDLFSKSWKRIVQRMAKQLVHVRVPRTYIKTTFHVDTNVIKSSFGWRSCQPEKSSNKSIV